MGNNIIKITGIDTSTTPNTLIMTNAGNAGVDPNDTVTWNIVGNNTGVGSISITVSANNPGLFSTIPAPIVVGNQPYSWSSVIAATATGSESYTITFTKTGSPEEYSHDPIIQINNK